MQPKPGQNYICHRCGEGGHFIKFCPTNGNPAYDLPNRRTKRPSGIPTTFLQVVHTIPEQERENLLELSSGQYARRVEDQEDFKAEMKKSTRKVPGELACNICSHPPRLAVMTRCCNLSFCFECISPALLPPEYRCPKCGAAKQYAHTLIPNLRMREVISALQNSTFELLENKT